MLQAGFTSWQAIIQQPRCNFTIRTLEPATSYQFRVIAYNKYGASKPSPPCASIQTKAKGWLIQQAKKNNVPPHLPSINIDGPSGESDSSNVITNLTVVKMWMILHVYIMLHIVYM